MPLRLRLFAATTTVAVGAPFALGISATSSAAATSGWRPRPATYDVAVERDVKIKMADGVEIFADIRRPAKLGHPVPGRFPVIVTQTAYNKILPTIGMANDYLVQRGYVQVLTDVRGTGRSGGEWQIWGPQEGRDGKQVVKWAASPDRPWSDGRVGLWGASYAGINQYLTAAQQPKGLKALFPVVPGGDLYRDFVGSGGQLSSLTIGFLPFVGILGAIPATDLVTAPVGAIAKSLAHLDRVGSYSLPVIAKALAGGDYAFDGPFFRERSPLTYIDNVKVPTFLVGGEQDAFQRSAGTLYNRVRANGVPAKFAYGPWHHVPITTAFSGLPPADVRGTDVRDLAVRWFDHYMRELPDPGLDTDIPPVSYYEQGANKWRTAAQWPPAGIKYRQLSPTGQALPGRPGRLTEGTGAGLPDFVAKNPFAGVCSRSTTQFLFLTGPLPCGEDNSANDKTGLTYDLPVTGQPLRFAGPINAHLYVSTPGKDGQLAVRLEDVAPDGTAKQISGGWQTLSLRALDKGKSVVANGVMVRPWHPYTKESIEYMQPGKPVPVDVEILPTAAAIQPGHKLRLAIQAGDFPHFLLPVPQALNSTGPGITLWHDSAHPSTIALPVQG